MVGLDRAQRVVDHHGSTLLSLSLSLWAGRGVGVGMGMGNNNLGDRAKKAWVSEGFPGFKFERYELDGIQNFGFGLFRIRVSRVLTVSR